jgi:RNA polymerase sigma factor (sigma-70 family)
VEASALPPSVAIARTRLALGAPLLRFRSDEQLVSLFRSGSEEAFRVIHDRYRQRMFAYTRQMLTGSAVDAEDAVQEIFVRAYSGLRASDRELALRAWLYRIAHNRCIDELRRPQSVATEAIPATVPNSGGDPVVRLEQRDALQRLIADVQRLPDQQRSALLMRELAGMTYADVAGALGVSVPAVKSLLVRARVGLAQASEARDTSCARIREDLIVSHDRGVRASGLARRHLRDCQHCRQFRSEVRGVSRQLAAFVPALGPIGVIAKLLGLGGAGGGGAAAGSSAVAGGTAASATAAGGLAGGGAAAGVGVLASGHVVTLLAAAVVTAGGAIELQHIAPPTPQHARHHHVVPAAHARATSAATSGGSVLASSAGTSTAGATSPAATDSDASSSTTQTASNPFASAGSATRTAHHRAKTSKISVLGPPLSETIDPDHWDYLYGISGGANGLANPSDSSSSTATPTSTPNADGTSPTPATGTATTPATTGTASPTPTASTAPTPSTGTAATGGTGTSSGTSATGTSSGGTTPSSSSSATGSTGSSSSTGSTSSTGKSNVTVTPATSKGSINPAKLPAAARPHGHGTIAVFTMTGN